MRGLIVFTMLGLAVPLVVLLASLPEWWEIVGLRAPFARTLEILVFGFVLTAIAYITHQVMRSFFSKNVPREPTAIAILAARRLQGLLVVLLLLATWLLFAVAAATFLDAISAGADIGRTTTWEIFLGVFG